MNFNLIFYNNVETIKQAPIIKNHAICREK